MKKVIKLVLISAILIFTSRLAMTEENIAFVSADYLFQNHPERKAIAAKLETEFKATVEKLTENKKKVDARIADVQKKVEAKVAALQKDAPKLRAADIKKREDEINKFASTEQATINKLVAEHDQQVRIYQDNYAKRENQETSKLKAFKRQLTPWQKKNTTPSCWMIVPLSLRQTVKISVMMF